LDEDQLAVNEPPDELVELDEAWDDLTLKHPDKAEFSRSKKKIWRRPSGSKRSSRTGWPG